MSGERDRERTGWGGALTAAWSAAMLLVTIKAACLYAGVGERPSAPPSARWPGRPEAAVQDAPAPIQGAAPSLGAAAPPQNRMLVFDDEAPRRPAVGAPPRPRPSRDARADALAADEDRDFLKGMRAAARGVGRGS